MKKQLLWKLFEKTGKIEYYIEYKKIDNEQVSKLEVLKGQVYKHFKGNIYKILLIAKDCTNLKKLVVYQDMSDENKIWVRDYDEFTSLVDTEKYPNVIQEYRFELIDND